jgi:hypothetical protein
MTFGGLILIKKARNKMHCNKALNIDTDPVKDLDEKKNARTVLFEKYSK